MRILVVDDEDQMRGMLRQMLENAGHEVSEAANGKIALNLQKMMPADLVIIDIIMPEMDGFELIKNIRQLVPPVKILSISGGGGINPDYYLSMAADLGADRTLKKPFTQSAIMSIIGKLFPDSNLTRSA